MFVISVRVHYCSRIDCTNCFAPLLRNAGCPHVPFDEHNAGEDRNFQVSISSSICTDNFMMFLSAFLNYSFERPHRISECCSGALALLPRLIFLLDDVPANKR